MADRNTILVVDDEPDVADLIRQRFKRHVKSGDFYFVAAMDGIEALEALDRNDEIDVVLTDIRMPRMDGLTLLSRLGELDRLLRSIVVTAYGDMQNLRTAMNRGAFDFLTKPLDLDDLEITIDKAIRSVEQQKRAEHVRELFGRYLSPDILASLLREPAALALGGERRRVTLLMSDLCGFTSLSERLPPEQVVELLNVYLGRMTDVIARYNGTIDEFIGDAIFVIFGAPIRSEGHALRAVACAVDMQLAMQDVNTRLNELNLPWIEMGIAVNTGEVVVGNIGSARRAKYGVVGSPVNLVSRMEGCTAGGQILISESTLLDAGPGVRTSRKFDVAAKGFSAPVSLYEVDGVGSPHHLTLPDLPDAARRPSRLPTSA